MKLSYTALRTFRDCHFRYHLRYHRGLASRPRPTAQSSRALHGALHLFHQDLKPQPAENALFPPAAVSLETLLAHLKGYYDNPTRPLTEAQYREGKALLTRYWETHRGQFPTPYLLEEPFKLHVGPFLLTGRFDRVDETPEGYEIVDYKLSHRNPLPPDPLQLEVYQLGFNAKTGQEAKKLSFYYLRLGEIESVEAGDLHAAQTRVRALCRDISREQEFHPREGEWCASCDFQEFCPAKVRNPRPVPTTGREIQLGFDFDR
jgi:RecB family exonuclease